MLRLIWIWKGKKLLIKIAGASEAAVSLRPVRLGGKRVQQQPNPGALLMSTQPFYREGAEALGLLQLANLLAVKSSDRNFRAAYFHVLVCESGNVLYGYNI